MNIEGKPLAPRPVRRTSNISGVKLESLVDKQSEIISNPFGPKSAKIKKVINWNNFHEEALQNERSEKIISDLDFESEIGTENAKSELLSILNGQNSPNYKNLFHGGVFCKFERNITNNSTYMTTEEEGVRSSMPPIRLNNPFYKNFESGNSAVECEFDMNLIKYKSSHLFKHNNSFIQGEG